MKLNQYFIVHSTENETMLVPTGNASFSGLVRGNRTMGEVLDLLKSDTDEKTIVAALGERYDAPEEVIAADVKEILSKLRSIGALDE